MRYLFLGIIVKLFSGLDNNIVHVSFISELTKTKKGKLFFVLGILFSVIVAIGISFLFAKALVKFPYSNKISAILIFIISFIVYFDLIKKIIKPMNEKINPSNQRLFKLLFLGFFIGIIMNIADIIVFSGLLLNTIQKPFLALAGLFIGTLLEIFSILSLSNAISRIPYKKQITFISLIVLSVFVWLGFI